LPIALKFPVAVSDCLKTFSLKTLSLAVSYCPCDVTKLKPFGLGMDLIWRKHGQKDVYVTPQNFNIKLRYSCIIFKQKNYDINEDKNQ